MYSCINLHFTDFCNFHCKHCFVKKENYELSFDEIKIVVDKIDDYFAKNGIKGRINLAGGEPLMSRNIDKIIDYIYSKGIEISIITNGYYLDEDFIKRHSNQINMIGISVDSLDYDKNIKIGRSFRANTISKEQLIYLCKIIKGAKIKLKINTCLFKININEDFNDFIKKVKPDRYKVLQMHCDENDEENKKNEITNDQANEFLSRIKSDYIYESAEDMTDSYIIIDSRGNITTNNSHTTNLSIFKYDLDEAIKTLNIDYNNYIKRYMNTNI